MNGCKSVDLEFVSGGYYSSNDCIFSSGSSSYATKYYVNVSRLDYVIHTSGPAGRYLSVCKYDFNKNFISNETISPTTVGSYSIDLDPNFLYRFSYNPRNMENLKAYQCDISVGSMANELAFGKLTFLDEINTIIPFVIPLIAFALGFLLLKKMIKRGSHGHA